MSDNALLLSYLQNTRLTKEDLLCELDKLIHDKARTFLRAQVGDWPIDRLMALRQEIRAEPRPMGGPPMRLQEMPRGAGDPVWPVEPSPPVLASNPPLTDEPTTSKPPRPSNAPKAIKRRRRRRKQTQPAKSGTEDVDGLT